MINFIIVEVVDRQNLPNTIVNFFVKLFTNNTFTNVWVRKPFSCSYCLTFWTSLIYLFCVISPTSFITIIVLSLINAIFTKVTYYILMMFDLFIELVFNWLHKLLKL